MTADSKHEFHPDAESLNAFAEEALGAQERGEIVMHLAECGRCREIVFLAQEAAAVTEMEMVPQLAAAAAAPQSNFEFRGKPWFRSWRFAWVPAGALVAMVTVAYVVHVRRAESISELAKVEPATALKNQATGMQSPPSAAKPPAAPLAMPPVAVAPPEPAATKMKSSDLGAAPGGMAFPNAAHAGESDKQPYSSSSAPHMPPIAAPPLPADAAGFAPAPASAVEQKRLEQSAAAMQSDQLSATEMQRAKRSEAAQRETISRGLVAAQAPKVDENAKSSAGLVAGARPLASGTFAAYKARPIELPSGLAAVSTAIANRHTVSVDAKGSVFVRERSDGEWEEVPKQWSGRAVTVRLQSAAGANAPTPAQPAAVFEIVNDQGQVWVSTNGKTWDSK